MRWALTAVATLAVAGCTPSKPSSTPEAAAGSVPPSAAASAATSAAPASAPATTPAPSAAVVGKVGPLPASDRIFAASLDAGPRDHLLGTDGDALWAAEPTAVGEGRLLWRVTGPGVVQRLVVGDLGRGRKLYVARGVGRGFLGAPLVLQELDPKTGKATELWRVAGPRNECAHLSIADVDRDGKPELAFAYYVSKYMVATRHLEADGSARPGAEVRMASTRAYGDLDGDGKPDEVVGRVYGDAKGDPGDLRVDFGQGAVRVPTENGVRSVLVAKLAGDTTPALYFADGWVANYGKAAKAQVKRATWDGKAWQVELVARAPGEFTFFDLRAVDMDGDGALELVGQGNKAVTRFSPSAARPWASKPLAALEPVLNTALARDGARWTVYVPHKPTTRAVPVPK